MSIDDPQLNRLATLLAVVDAAAKCKGMDPDAFFPTKPDDPSTVPAECNECPVSTECLVIGLTPLGEYGMWGGYTEAQRRQMRRDMLRRREVESPDSLTSPLLTGSEEVA